MSRGPLVGHEVRVNGRPHRLAGGTLLALLRQLDLVPSPAGIAVAINGRVVPRGEWEQREICAGDEVEIVGATQGG